MLSDPELRAKYDDKGDAGVADAEAAFFDSSKLFALVFPEPATGAAAGGPATIGPGTAAVEPEPEPAATAVGATVFAFATFFSFYLVEIPAEAEGRLQWIDNERPRLGGGHGV